MITMEFEEMKKIWDAQNNEPMYSINEKALHNRILTKRNQAHHITRISELLGIFVNFGAGLFILGMNAFGTSESVFMYILSAWMLCTGLYMLFSRFRRIQGDKKFDRSMMGDLDYAISMATYQVRFSQLGRWNILPMAVLVILGLWEGGKSPWWMLGLVVFFALANYAAGWEHGIYKNRKKELDGLKSKLINNSEL
jgi:hypothetical protein